MVCLLGGIEEIVPPARGRGAKGEEIDESPQD
jgi:hypothetical protein